MNTEIITYLEMCQREKTSLQQGMNFRIGGSYSVLLMSIRKNAPYEDSVLDDGTTLIYEGHDSPRSSAHPLPKQVDQPEFKPNGRPTQNGLFHKAAIDYKSGRSGPELVRVYEKLRDGIWADNGIFELIDSWLEEHGQRKVFKFKLRVSQENVTAKRHYISEGSPNRQIPSSVKQAVWKRDGGKCVECGAATELHFDHVIPYSKGGTSLIAENIQLLCARHNLGKHDRIE
jgi:hypothetical protein